MGQQHNHSWSDLQESVEFTALIGGVYCRRVTRWRQCHVCGVVNFVDTGRWDDPDEQRRNALELGVTDV